MLFSLYKKCKFEFKECIWNTFNYSSTMQGTYEQSNLLGNKTKWFSWNAITLLSKITEEAPKYKAFPYSLDR